MHTETHITANTSIKLAHKEQSPLLPNLIKPSLPGRERRILHKLIVNRQHLQTHSTCFINNRRSQRKKQRKLIRQRNLKAKTMLRNFSFVVQYQYLPQLTNNIPRTVSTFAIHHILPHRISKLPTIHTKHSPSLRLQHLPYRYTIPNINSLTRIRIISNLPDRSQCSSGSSNCPKSVGYGYQSLNLKHNLLNQPMILSTLQT